MNLFQKYRSARILFGSSAQLLGMGIMASAGAILCSPTAASAASFTLNASNNNSGIFNFTGEIDTVNIATTGVYTLDVLGAGGGSNGSNFGGRGGQINGNITLDAGTILSILVGQRGENGGSGSNGGTFGGGGGGGATFVVTVLNGTPTPLITAGGGGSGRGIIALSGTGGGRNGGNGGNRGLQGINGGFVSGTNSVGGFGGNGGFGGGEGGLGGDGARQGFGGNGGNGISFVNGIPTTIDGGSTSNIRNFSIFRNELIGNGGSSANLFSDFIAAGGFGGVSSNVSNVSFNNDTQAGDGRVSISLISSPTAVPEPLTIIGTIIGGTAAMRLRKKLKSTVEK
jgi:hypothetical protein